MKHIRRAEGTAEPSIRQKPDANVNQFAQAAKRLAQALKRFVIRG